MAVLIGTAKPRPSLPPLCEAICSLMPMTSPRESMSGPPELPWLMAASVWMPLGMVAPFGDSSCGRGGDDTRGEREVEAQRVADGHDRLADLDLVGIAERQRLEVEALGSTLSTATSADVDADDLALMRSSASCRRS